jgi:hypothetical protein
MRLGNTWYLFNRNCSIGIFIYITKSILLGSHVSYESTVLKIYIEYGGLFSSGKKTSMYAKFLKYRYAYGKWLKNEDSRNGPECNLKTALISLVEGSTIFKVAQISICLNQFCP